MELRALVHRRAVGRRTGFSIPELLAVLVVTSILATLAIVASRLPRARADLTRLRAEAHNLQLAQEAYRAYHGQLYNGPFTADAIRQTDFSYTPPPGVTIVVISTDPTDWQATLSGEQSGSQITPNCRLALSGATNIVCQLTADRQEGAPGDGTTGGAYAPERVPTTQ